MIGMTFGTTNEIRGICLSGKRASMSSTNVKISTLSGHCRFSTVRASHFDTLAKNFVVTLVVSFLQTYDSRDCHRWKYFVDIFAKSTMGSLMFQGFLAENASKTGSERRTQKFRATLRSRSKRPLQGTVSNCFFIIILFSLFRQGEKPHGVI